MYIAQAFNWYFQMSKEHSVPGKKSQSQPMSIHFSKDTTQPQGNEAKHVPRVPDRQTPKTETGIIKELQIFNQ